MSSGVVPFVFNKVTEGKTEMIITKQYIKDNLSKSAIDFFEKNFTTSLDTDKMVVTGGDGNGFWEHIRLRKATNTTYDNRGNVISRGDKFGTNTFKYDDQNRQIECRFNGNLVTYHKYDKRGNLVEHMTHTGFIEKMKYNKRNELIWDINSRLETTRTRNSKGLVTKLIEADNNGWKRVTSYKYDANGNILMINHNNKSKNLYKYDDNNRLIYEKSPSGDVTTHEYDDIGRKTKRRSTFTGIETTWEYTESQTIIRSQMYLTGKVFGLVKLDKNDNQTYLKDENGVITRIWHNKYGRKTKQKNSIGCYEVIKYDYKQRVIEKTDFVPNHHRYSSTFTWKYNRKDKLIAKSDGLKKTHERYRYDKRGNLIYHEVSKGKKTCIKTWRYHHNKQGNLTSIVYCDKYKQMTIKYL